MLRRIAPLAIQASRTPLGGTHRHRRRQLPRSRRGRSDWHPPPESPCQVGSCAMNTEAPHSDPSPARTPRPRSRCAGRHAQSWARADHRWRHIRCTRSRHHSPTPRIMTFRFRGEFPPRRSLQTTSMRDPSRSQRFGRAPRGSRCHANASLLRGRSTAGCPQRRSRLRPIEREEAR